AASSTLPRAIRRAAPGLLLAVMLALSLRAFPAHGAPATVTPLPAPTIAPTEGVAYSGSAGSFTDTDLTCSTDPLTATIDWGEQRTPARWTNLTAQPSRSRDCTPT